MRGLATIDATKPSPSPSSSDKVGAGRRAGVAAPAPPEPQETGQGGAPWGPVHIIHHVQEALVEQSVVWRSDVKGLGSIIFWLDAVRRVVLLNVPPARNHESDGQSARRRINFSPVSGERPPA